MEAQEQHLMASNDDLTHNNIILKGKRTKRQRSSSPAPSKAAMITSSSSSTCGGGGVFVEDYGSISSPTTSSNYEEVDMANCLILLAQGEGPRPTGNNPRTENSTAGKFSDLPMTTAAATGPGFYVYECKTCNRSFPSFQALGGHRASHKKPKATAEEVKKSTPPISNDVGGDCQLNQSSHDDRYLPISIHIAAVTSVATGKKGVQGNHKGKIHGCTICGSKFMSGQALGGHMRRHRPNNNNNNNTENQTVIIMGGFDNCESDINGEIKGSGSVLSLDLNLPAPEDDHLRRESGPEFQFGSTKQALMFSAPALVDCHY